MGPAVSGHIGAYIAAEVFDIDLAPSATVAGQDGVFRAGPSPEPPPTSSLYGKRERLLYGRRNAKTDI